MSRADGIASIADPLPDYLVRFRIDLGDRDLENGSPDVPQPKRDLATAAGDPRLNRRDDSAGLAVNPRDSAITLIECPDRSGAGGFKTRPGAYSDRVGDLVRLRIDAGQHVLCRGG